MKKRFLASLLALGMLLTMVTGAAWAADGDGADTPPTTGSCGDNLTWSYDTATKTLTISGSGDMMEFDASNPCPWSGYRNNIEVVEIEDDVTSISPRAFDHYTMYLTTVNIGNGVTTIGNNAFAYCYMLNEVTLGNNVTTIGDGAFSNCRSLTEITLPDNLQNIGTNAFSGTGLTSIHIPAKVHRIGTGLDDLGINVDNSFGNCKSLTEISVDPNNITYSSNDGVLFNKNKTTLLFCPQAKTTCTIPMETTQIGPCAFVYCSELTQVNISSNVTSIGKGAFASCSKLTQIDIPSNITSIEDRTFENCSKLTQINIPSSVTSIGSGAFRDCKSLSTITIPSSVTTIRGGAFSGCTSLTNVTVPNLGTYGLYGTFAGCTNLTTVTIGEGTKGINGAFDGCTKLTTVNIPASVTAIAKDSFKGCTNLKEINFAGTKADWEKMVVLTDNPELRSATIKCSDGDIPASNTPPTTDVDAPALSITAVRGADEKVTVTVPAPASGNKFSYKFGADTELTVPKVGSELSTTEWKELPSGKIITPTEAEKTAAYIAVAEVTADNKVVKWGKIQVTSGGTTNPPENATGLTVSATKTDTEATLTITGKGTGKHYYKFGAESDLTAPKVDSAFTTEGWKLVPSGDKVTLTEAEKTATHVAVVEVTTDNKVAKWGKGAVSSATPPTTDPKPAEGLSVTAKKDSDGKITVTVTGETSGNKLHYLFGDSSLAALKVGEELPGAWKELKDKTFTPDSADKNKTYIAIAETKDGKVTKWGKGEIKAASTPGGKPDELTLSPVSGGLGKKVSVEIGGGHWLTIRVEKGTSVALSSIQAPSGSGKTKETFSAPSGSKVKVWETEKEITFGSNGSVSADIIAVGEITL